MHPLLAVCGLYCGACYHYRASFPEGSHLLAQALRQGRSLEGYTCQGCRSDRHYIHQGCDQCQIRACAEEKGLLHCGQCEQIPCQRLTDFRCDGHIHHLPILEQLEQLNFMGPGAWLEAQEKRWTCTCGSRFSWYEETCRQCGKPLEHL